MSNFSDGDEAKVRLRSTITNVVSDLEQILVDTKLLLERDGAKSFADGHVNKCGGAIKSYYTMLKNLGVLSRNDVDALCTRFYADESLREAVDSLYDVEERYDEFLTSVDAALRKEISDEALWAGSSAPMECTFQDLSQSVSTSRPLEDCMISLHDIISCPGKSTLLILLRHLS